MKNVIKNSVLNGLIGVPVFIVSSIVGIGVLKSISKTFINSKNNK